MRKFNVSFSYTNKLCALAVITLMLYCALSLWNVNFWQQSILKRSATVQPSAFLKKARLPEERRILKRQQFPLVLSNVDLPSPPELPEQQKALMQKVRKTHTNARLIQSTVKHTRQELPIPSPASSAQKSTKAKARGASAIYQQLISNNAINIELALPNKINERQDILSFLYQCIGVRFGVLRDQKVYLAKTTKHHSNTNKEQTTSQWLRIAQGQLTNTERNWLQQYNLSGTPIRLFPKVVDWKLSELINYHLHDEPLRSLRAHYKYKNQRLLLTNITLNNHQVEKDWELITKNCITSK